MNLKNHVHHREHRVHRENGFFGQPGIVLIALSYKVLTDVSRDNEDLKISVCSVFSVVSHVFNRI